MANQSETEQKVTPIVRDMTFTRAVADRGLVMNLGRDIEIAFLQMGPQPVEVQDHESGESDLVKMTPAYTEVVRLRMSAHSTLDLALQIIKTNAEDGRLDLEAVGEAIRSFGSKRNDSEGQTDVPA